MIELTLAPLTLRFVFVDDGRDNRNDAERHCDPEPDHFTDAACAVKDRSGTFPRINWA